MGIKGGWGAMTSRLFVAERYATDWRGKAYNAKKQGLHA
jgi:hypothetical protein